MSPAAKRSLWFGAIGLVGLICLVAVCAGAFPSRGGDPTGYVREHYQRAAFLDEPDGGKAYTSSRSRASTVRDLRDHTDELDHRLTGGVDFLQYGDHIIAVHDRGTGSKIYIDDYRDGYQRYATAYSGFAFFGWSSSPPGASGFRGGGGGIGK